MMKMSRFLNLLFLFFLPAIQLSAQCDHYDRVEYDISENCQLPRYINIRTINVSQGVNLIIMNGRDTIGTDSSISVKLSQYQNYSFKIISYNSACRDTSTLNYDLKPSRKSKALSQNSIYTKYPIFTKCITGTITDTFLLHLDIDTVALDWKIDWDDVSKIQSGDSLKNISHLYQKLGAYNPKIYYKNGDCVDTIIGRVIVEREPVAGIAFGSPLGSNQGCVPFTTKFINQTKYRTSNTKFTWETGDGTTFETDDDTISHTYTKYLCDGVVRMTAKNNCGQSVATWNPIQASTKDEAIFIIQNPNICDTSKFYEFKPAWKDKYCTLPDIRSFKWIWGDGTSTDWTTSLNVVKRKFNYGEYKIKFLVRNGCGIDTSEYTLLVIDKPIASIHKVYNDTGCSPHTIDFSTQSKLGENYSWNFGDGGGASGSSVKWTYKNAGMWIVRLNVTNKCGNAQSFDTINIYRKAIPKFTVDETSGCWPLKIAIKNSTTENGVKNLEWEWYLDDSIISTNKEPNFNTILNPGNYKFKLITIDFCGLDSTIKKVDIYEKPISTFDTSFFKKCQNDEIKFRNNSTSADSSIWITQQGVFRYAGIKDLDITFKTSGEKTITLISKTKWGCLDTQVSKVWIRPTVSAYFYNDNTSGCGPLKITFTNKSISIDSFRWSFNSKTLFARDTISHVFQGRALFDTIYKVKMYGWSSGCRIDSFESDILLRGNPIAKFSSDRDTFCFPEKVTFFNQSLRSVKFQWNLGQGIITNTPNPQAYFPKNPDYLKDTSFRVTLTAFGDVSNCVSRDTQIVVVKPYPIPKLYTSDLGGCSPYKAKFISNSINSIQSNWDFGNGFSLNGDTVNHTFINWGSRDTSFRVTLRVKNIDCYDSSSIIIPVYAANRSNFDFNRIGNCNDEIWKFTDLSQNSNKWLWNFGDGTLSKSQSPSHVFKSSAYSDTNYLVKLVAFSDRGCIDSSEKIIRIKQRLEVGMLDSSLNACPPYTHKFENKSKGATAFIWNFGDGAGSSDPNPTHTYTRPGEWRYKLKAFDINGCVDSILSMGVISIKEKPKAIIWESTNQIKFPDSTINFSDKSLRGEYSNWSFSDGYNSNLTDFQKKFGDSGDYIVRLISKNLGCSDTTYSNVRVNWWDPLIEVYYNNDTQCAPATYKFNNISKYADRWTWYFGDGSRTSKEKSPTHVYSFGGDYRAILIADGPGGRSTAYFNIKVLKSPTSQFEFSKSEYERLYYNWFGFPTNYSLWNVQNDWIVVDDKRDSIYFMSELFEPMIKLNKPGRFTVILVTTSEDGCRDSFEREIELETLPKIFVPNAFTPNRDRNNENFGVYISNDRVPINDFKLEIYNRWGEKVFYSSKIEQKWNGTFMNKECEQGVYAWKVEMNIGGTILNQSGTVSLLK